MKSPFTSTVLLLSLSLPLTLSTTAQNESTSDATPPPVKQLSEHEFQLDQITFNKKTRRIEFPGRINTREDLLEYLLVHKDGKTHESLLATDISPFHLNIVMLLAGYKPGPGSLFDEPPVDPNQEKNIAPDPLAQVQFTVTWTTENEAPVTTRPETLILNRFTGDPMKPAPWQFNGSFVENGQFQAELEGSIAAVYLDRWAMFNSTRPGNNDDLRWQPILEKLPPKNTPVTIVIEPFTDQ
ncbi:MAG: YdjY domain-containing protein [Verrucomicrobiota bacterium]